MEEESPAIPAGSNEVIDLSENYQFARVIQLIELKEYICEEKKKKVASDVSNITLSSFVSSFMNVQTAESSETVAVEDYWNNKLGSNQDALAAYENLIYDIRVLQKTFRVWIKLRIMRSKRKIASATNEKTIMIQAAVRRWVARKQFATLEHEKQQREKAFSLFCAEMKKGVLVDMFSRKYGTINKRTMKFDSSYEKIVYKTSSWSSGFIPCNAIYAVNKGLSDATYSQATANHKAWCINLHILGGRIVDFQAKDSTSAKMLYDGFQHMCLLLFTQAPFYTDKEGFPRRAGPSVIQRALDIADETGGNEASKSSASEADYMRHRAALRLLKGEYARWSDSLQSEHEAWEEHIRSISQDGVAPSERSQSNASALTTSATRSRQESAASKKSNGSTARSAASGNNDNDSVATSRCSVYETDSVVASSRGSRSAGREHAEDDTSVASLGSKRSAASSVASARSKGTTQSKHSAKSHNTAASKHSAKSHNTAESKHSAKSQHTVQSNHTVQSQASVLSTAASGIFAFFGGATATPTATANTELQSQEAQPAHSAAQSALDGVDDSARRPKAPATTSPPAAAVAAVAAVEEEEESGEEEENEDDGEEEGDDEDEDEDESSEGEEDDGSEEGSEDTEDSDEDSMEDV